MAISLYVPTRLKFLPAKTPTVPPPPDLSDGTPVYLYAVICSSDCPSGTPPRLLYADPRGIYKFLKMLRTFAGLFAVSPLCDL